LELAAIDAGAEDIFEEPETGETVIHTAQNDLAKVRDALKGASHEVVDAELTYVPNNTLEISEPETARKIIRLMDTLDDLDDVAATHTNFELAEGLNVS
jgi:transcriptional/translational regulatory protein YebC/TACO1